MSALVRTMVLHSNIIIIGDQEAVIFMCEADEESFLATGEESGEEYKIMYDEIDINTTFFYGLKLLDSKDFGNDAEKRKQARELFEKMLDNNVEQVLSVLSNTLIHN